jgi:hypothetical protein
MRTRPKAVFGYAMGWVITICFVVLFSVIFSFVGTIICAALAGMMMGAARLPWWQSFALSMVFPGVISTTLRITRTELPAGQIVFVAMLCFAIFWVIYFALRALTAQEKVQSAEARRASTRVRVSPRQTSTGVARPAPGCASGCGNGADTGLPAVSLQMLQGTWFARNGSPDTLHHRAIEISQDTLVVRLTDSQGQEQCLARGHLRICQGCILGITGQQLDPEAQVCI